MRAGAPHLAWWQLSMPPLPGADCRRCALPDPGLSAFPHLQPYAETGPIFLHAEECAAYDDGDTLPPIFESPDYIVRGYGHDDRIVYGTGAVTETPRIAARAQELLQDEKIAYVHVRSARNNCFQCRIERTPVGEHLPEGLETA